MQNDLTVIYYTSNFLEEENPYFLRATKRQLALAIGDLDLIVVSHHPVPKNSFFEYALEVDYKGTYTNLVAGKDFKPYAPGRHHLNIYQNIMIGSDHAKTKYVAMAEDDILYSYSHFHSPEMLKLFQHGEDMFLYDMNKVSLFTWTNPPIFSFRSKRMVVNQLIAPAKMLSEAMHERFDRLEVLVKNGWTVEKAIKYWGDPGRYERILGVKERPTYQFYSNVPSIVFTHPKAYGFLNHGTRKRHGDLRIVELADWGKASDILKLWGKVGKR